MALINISDPGAKYTDEEIKALEEKINSVYSEAQVDMQKKLDDFTAKFKKKDAEYHKKYIDGEITKEEYNAWRKGQVFTGKQWIAKKKEITAVLNNSNKVATAMINSSAVGVFAENANFLSYSLEHTAGANFGFGLYNTDTVTKLIKDDPELLPKWKINQAKDYIWNQQNLNRSLTQGIIQGESLDKISKRVSTSLAGSNQNLMKTFTKTGMTQAQNSGRVTQLERAKAKGLNVKKEWVATLDARTRTSHQELDGQTVDLDKPFKAEGYSIRYPGDPEAHPSLVYNCRCALVGDLVDYPATYDRYDNIAGKPIKGMNYKQWKEAKSKGEDLSPIPLTYKQFKSKEQQIITDLFKSKSMSGLMKDIHEIDVPASNQFYKILGETDVKPAKAWQQYIDGTLNPKTTKKLDSLLKGYGEKSGLIKEPVNLVDQFKDKKVSNIWKGMQEVDVSLSNKFWKDIAAMDPEGHASKAWAKYLVGELDPEDVAKLETHLEKYLKKLDGIKVTPPQKGSPVILAKTTGDASDIVKLEKAQKELNDLDKNLAKINQTYSGIWKEDVTLADYAEKKSKIAAKKKYYEEQIEKYKGSAYANIDWAPKEIAKYENYLKQLDEFETLGKTYAADFAKRDALRKEVQDLLPIDPMFSDARKNAALWVKSSNEYKTADKYFETVASKVHGAKTAAEHDGYYHYTWGSMPFNSPLAGYKGDRYTNFVGVGKVDINVGGYGNKIRSLTSLIEKSKYDEDFWIQSAQGHETIEAFLNIPYGSLAKMTEKEVQQFIGIENEIPQFISGAINKGGGSYNPGNMTINIYCPSGSEALYVSSDGRFGKAEHEMILQRGGTYKITRIYKDIGTHRHKEWIFDIELHPEKGYNKFQQ